MLRTWNVENINPGQRALGGGSKVRKALGDAGVCERNATYGCQMYRCVMLVESEAAEVSCAPCVEPTFAVRVRVEYHERQLRHLWYPVFRNQHSYSYLSVLVYAYQVPGMFLRR